MAQRYGDYRKAMGLSNKRIKDLEDTWDPLAD